MNQSEILRAGGWVSLLSRDTSGEGVGSYGRVIHKIAKDGSFAIFVETFAHGSLGLWGRGIVSQSDHLEDLLESSDDQKTRVAEDAAELGARKAALRTAEEAVGDWRTFPGGVESWRKAVQAKIRVREGI